MTDVLFESNRLMFRPVDLSDLESIVALNSNEEVMRYFPSIMSVEESSEYVHKIIAHHKKEGFSLYAVCLKDSQSFIGLIGLLRVNFASDIKGEVEIGWRLLPKYWHKGYATEGAIAVLKDARERLQQEKVYSFTSVINEPSKKVMKSIGMTYLSDFDHPHVTENTILKKHCLYMIELTE